MENKAQKKSREFIGVVVSSTAKTIIARVDRMKMNSKYNKAYRTSKKYHVHDEKGLAKTGDTARFIECRPISKTKKWRLIEIIKK